MNLTARQQQIVDLIRRHIADTGYPPTRAEIAQALGFRSINAAEDHPQTVRQVSRVGGIGSRPTHGALEDNGRHKRPPCVPGQQLEDPEHRHPHFYWPHSNAGHLTEYLVRVPVCRLRLVGVRPLLHPPSQVTVHRVPIGYSRRPVILKSCSTGTRPGFLCCFAPRSRMIARVSNSGMARSVARSK